MAGSRKFSSGTRPFLLFHWSPVERRKQILREGLCPGKFSRARDWKPPYVCFSRYPSMAWALSAEFSDELGEWDLWQVWSTQLDGWEVLFQGGDHQPTEYRVYHRVRKGQIWYVGTREYKPRGK